MGTGRVRDPKVVIIGTGIGGLGVAIHLKREGLENLVLLEQGPDLGGVWRDNTYPGAACDVPSTLYSYSFERKVQWRDRYSGQADILQYLRTTAEKYDITRHIEFERKVTAAKFDERTGQWRVSTEQGEDITADVVISAVGTLARPKLPTIEGRDRFAGPAFHSARWRHDVSLEGKKVAVIGTGASALQFVPHVQREAASITVFQRSAPHVMPVHNYSYDDHKLMATRPMQEWDRFSFWYVMELGQQILTRTAWRPLGKLVEFMTKRHLKKQVKDPTLQRKLTPDAEFGCKRVLFSSSWYPALSQPNAEVETDAIAEIVPEGVRTASGKLHEADVLIYGTGFQTDDILGHIEITGQEGRLLADRWKEGAHAYLGMAVPEFPNLFFVYGPNTDLGSGSVPFMLESQFPYIRQAVVDIATRPAGAYLTMRESCWEEFDREIQKKAAKTTWVSGCSNWYTNEHGRVVTNWPMRSWRYRRRTRRFDVGKYDVDVADSAVTT